MEWFVFALSAAFLVSITSVIEKKVLFREHATEFSATIAVMNFLITIPFFYLVDFTISPEIIFFIFVAGVFASVGFLFIAKAMRHMEISAVSPLMNLGPGFTAIFAVLILSEMLSPLNIIGIVTLISGSYILEIDFKSHNITTPIKKIWKSRYIHYVFLAMGSYSISAITCKYVLEFTDPVTLIFVEQFFIVLVFLAILQLFYDGIGGIKHGIKKIGKWVIIMPVLIVSYRLLQSVAIQMTYVSLVIPIKRLSTLFSTVMGGGIFREHGLYKKIIACAIMIVGACLVIIG